jgi:hypothetical protein
MDINPYAPPAAAPSVTGQDKDSPTGSADFRTERRPVAVCILLALVTLGVYQAIWLFKRRPFLDSFAQSRKLGVQLPTAVLVLNVLGIVVAIASGLDSSLDRLDQLARLAGGFAYLIACFRVKNMLRTEFRIVGFRATISPIMTFFFGIYYLQYMINQAADATASRSAR